MRKLFQFIAILMLLSSIAVAQCPVAGFNMPDSTCSGSTIQVTNTSSGALNYLWDFCPGDMNAVPVPFTLPSDPSLNFPQQNCMVNDGGNYYLFVINYSSSTLLRYDFGNSPDNTPVIFSYGNAGLISSPAGVSVINDNGIWYAFVANNSSGAIIRINLGTVISDNIFSSDNLGLSGLSFPAEVKVVFDGSDYFLFATSNPNDLVKYSFGNSLANTPSAATVLTEAVFNSPWGFDIAYDCSINTWVGFVGSYNGFQINTVDFGSSLSNAGTVVASYNCIFSPTGISLVRDGAQWFLMVNGISPFVSERLQKIPLSGSLLSAPLAAVSYVEPALTSPRSMSLVRVGSSFRGFVSCCQPNSIVKLVFEEPCDATPAFSTDPSTVNVTFNSVNVTQPIALSAMGASGFTNYFVDSVLVQEIPITGFSNTPGCDGDAVFFTDTSIVNSSLNQTWLWDFGDASPINTQQNPSHIYPGNGTYIASFTLTYETGCLQTVTDTIEVNPKPAADFSFANNQCAKVPVSFNDLSTAFSGATLVAWNWNFGDNSQLNGQQNPSHSFSLPGNYSVTLVVTTSTGCTDTISKIIAIIPSPESAFTVSSTCVGEVATFTNTTSIIGGGSITYNWDFGDTFTSISISPTHQYALTAANYNVTLIANASNGCKDTLTTDVRIANKPVAQFSYSPTVVCKSNQVTFSNSSFGIGTDTIASYYWDFGDNGNSILANPTHAYSDTGYFSVTLTVMSLTACDSSLTQQVYVIPSPTASFTANNVCLGVNTVFNPLTTTPPSTQIDSIVWDFGDGNTFTGLTSPSHNYTLPGKYGVTMTVYNNLLCTGFYADSVDVYPIPVAAFTSSLACSQSVINFDGTSSQVVNDTITSWLWNFDGLGNGTGSTTGFTFANAGTFNVTLIATTIHGCQGSVVNSINVIQSPQFDFSFNEPCYGFPANYTYIPLVTPAPASVLTWDFGDATISSQLSPSHIYASVDTFFVSLTVLQNSTGCSASFQKPLIIKPNPQAGFAFNNSCEQLPVLLNDTSVISSGSIVSWNWNFGVLGTSNITDPTITPILPGVYPIGLTVTSDKGCVGTSTNSLTVFAKPVAAFTPDPLYGSPPLTVNFSNQSTGGVTFEWDFGDGNSSIGTNVSHVYQDTGLYNIVLVTTSAEGCIDSVDAYVSALIPYMDLAVNKIYISENNNLLTVAAELLNKGNVPVSTFEIRSNIQNGSVINESWSGNFLPGDALIYTFNARYDINSKSLPGFYCVEVLNPNNSIDQNLSNNNKCDVISNVFELFAAFPNPFNDQLSVNFNLPFQGDFELAIFDMSGKIVYDSGELSGAKGYNKMIIPTANFSKGIYAVVVRYRDEVKTINVLNN